MNTMPDPLSPDPWEAKRQLLAEVKRLKAEHRKVIRKLQDQAGSMRESLIGQREVIGRLKVQLLVLKQAAERRGVPMPEMPRLSEQQRQSLAELMA